MNEMLRLFSLLAALVLLFVSASAVTCNDIDIQLEPVGINAGSSGYFTFDVKNNSVSDFEFDYFDAYDDNAYIIVDESDYDENVNAGNTGKLRVWVYANSSAPEGTAKGFIEVAGDFDSGYTCSLSNFGTLSFDIVVGEQGSGTGTGAGPAACSDIDILSGNAVSVDSGAEVYETYYLENISGKAFYIDEFSAGDEDRGFVVSSAGSEESARANDRAELNVKVMAHATENDSAGKGYMEVAGHFSNGTECSKSNIGKDEFTVFVKGSGEKAECSDFYYSVPLQKMVAETGAIEIEADNPLGRDALIRISGSGISIAPKTIAVPAGSSVRKDVGLDGFAAESAVLVYSVELPGCNVLEKTTLVLKPEDIVEVVSYTSKSEIVESAGIQVSLKNKSAEAKDVKVSIGNLPSLWVGGSIDGTLNAGEAKTYLLNVKAKSARAGESYFASLKVEYDDVVIEKGIELEAKTIGDLDNVNIAVNVVQNADGNGSYLISVKLINNSGEDLKGILDLSAPEGWKVEGAGEIEVLNGQSVERQVTVKPNAEQTEGAVGLLRFRADDGRKVEAFIAYSTQGEMALAALVALGSSGFLLGVAAIAAMLFAISYMKFRPERWQRVAGK